MFDKKEYLEKRSFTFEGFDVDIFMIEDDESHPEHWPDLYEPQDITAWNEGTWQFVEMVVTVKLFGIVISAGGQQACDLGYDSDGDFQDPFEMVEAFGLVENIVEDAQQVLAVLALEGNDDN